MPRKGYVRTKAEKDAISHGMRERYAKVKAVLLESHPELVGKSKKKKEQAQEQAPE